MLSISISAGHHRRIQGDCRRDDGDAEAGGRRPARHRTRPDVCRVGQGHDGRCGHTADRRCHGLPPFTHRSDRLRVSLTAPSRAGDEVSFTVTYTGVPAEGLRLIDNIHGQRVVFSENWPNRARQWLPTIDHPYDKATGEFVVTAPAQYQVVANGLLIEELDLPGARRQTHWKQSVPISSWLYALGVARFSVAPRGPRQGRRAADVGISAGPRDEPLDLRGSVAAGDDVLRRAASARIRTRSSPTCRLPA